MKLDCKMSYDELNSMILEVDPKIRFSGVANNKSELISATSRKNSDKLLSDDEVKMSIHYTLERWEENI